MSDQFEKGLKQTLAAGAARVDQRTRDELARRRQVALDSAAKTRSRAWLWAPVGAVSAVLVAAILAQPYTARQELPVVESGDDEFDMEIFLAEESFELYEDLEFYEWLDVAGDAG